MLEAMGKYNEDLVQAGVMVDSDGLQSSPRGARIHFKINQRTVVVGPFSETRELVAGYWIGKCKDLA